MTIFSRLNPLRRLRARRLEQYREIENHEWMGVIEAHVKNRGEKEREIDLALHREGRTGISWLTNREIRMTAMVLESQRELIPARIEIRKRLGKECAELLSDAEIVKLEESMLQSVRTSRAARRGDYKRRAQAAELPTHRPEQQDAAEYGALEALIRREMRKLVLDRTLGRTTESKRAFGFLAKIWQDPVGSKVISAGIIAVFGLIAGGAIGQHLHWWTSSSPAEHPSVKPKLIVTRFDLLPEKDTAAPGGVNVFFRVEGAEAKAVSSTYRLTVAKFPGDDKEVAFEDSLFDGMLRQSTPRNNVGDIRETPMGQEPYTTLTGPPPSDAVWKLIRDKHAAIYFMGRFTYSDSHSDYCGFFMGDPPAQFVCHHHN